MGSIPFDTKEICLSYMFQFIGKWYKWGGDDPDGFDCSGLVVEYLQAAGKVGRKEDLNAQLLFSRFPKTSEPVRGGLVYWHAPEDPDRIIHVEIILNEKLSLGASGGGSSTKTVTDAMRDNAFIKIRAFRTRENLAGFNDPFFIK